MIHGRNGSSFLAVDARGSLCGGTVTSTTPYHTKPFFDQKRKISRAGNWRGAAPQYTQNEKCTKEAVKKEVPDT